MTMVSDLQQCHGSVEHLGIVELTRRRTVL
jgi:hypothetical protein